MPRQADPWFCEEEKATSMPELPAAVSLPSANSVPAEILFCTYLPGSQQESESTALAAQAGKSKLLLRCAARESVNRVQAWREKHPQYGREAPLRSRPLQETIVTQPADRSKESVDLALQEMIRRQVGESAEDSGMLAAQALQDSM